MPVCTSMCMLVSTYEVKLLLNRPYKVKNGIECVCTCNLNVIYSSNIKYE